MSQTAQPKQPIGTFVKPTVSSQNAVAQKKNPVSFAGDMMKFIYLTMLSGAFTTMAATATPESNIAPPASLAATATTLLALQELVDDDKASKRTVNDLESKLKTSQQTIEKLEREVRQLKYK